MASRKPEDKDYEVIMPGRGTNHLLDPTQVNEHFELGTTEKKRMMERLSGDRSNDQRVKQNAALGTDASIGTGALPSYMSAAAVSGTSDAIEYTYTLNGTATNASVALNLN